MILIKGEGAMYYTFNLKPMTELSNELYMQYNARPETLLDGQSLIFTNQQEALNAAQNLLLNKHFYSNMPVIPNVILLVSLQNATLDGTELSHTERESIGLPNDASNVYRGTYTPSDIKCFGAVFQADALHQPIIKPAGVRENGDINIADISATARNRVNALDKLTDILYLVPRERRAVIMQELQSTDMSGEKGQLLKMALSTDQFTPNTLPTTKSIANSTKLDVKSMKGFVQANPAGLDFGARLFQQTAKALLQHTSAETIFALPKLYKEYAENLNKYSNPNEMQCVSAMGRALASIENTSLQDMPHIMNLKYSLRDLQSMIVYQMEDRADQSITAIVQAVPAEQQPQARQHALKMINAETKDELELMTQCYAAAASLGLSTDEYAVAHTALNAVWMENEIQKSCHRQIDAMSPENYKTFMISIMPADAVDKFTKLYQEELDWLQQRHPSMAPARMAIYAAQDTLCDMERITKDVSVKLQYQPLIEQTVRDEQHLSELETRLLDETCI